MTISLSLARQALRRSIQESASALGRELTALVHQESGLDALVQRYDSHAQRLQFGDVNGDEIKRDLAKELGDILQKKIKALKIAVEFAEQAAASYVWDGKLELEKVKKLYVHSKRIDDEEEGYEYEEQFKRRVNTNVSSVHIPVEIYEGDIEILNGLLWTNELDEIWQKNKEEDPELIWQYFGSQTGIMRIYPASKWRGESVDLYDVRRRPWYTLGASSPKDMFILVDTSGSTHGQALALMKQSVLSLIDTLGENDFVNVAHFAAKPENVSCFKEFVQANHWNKQILYEAVNNLEAKGMANYHEGFKYAFEQFRKLNESSARHSSGAACNRIIMFLTDGGTEMPEEVFKKYNANKEVRIFSYAVGPTANPIAAPRWIACSNRGYFYKIPAMGAIRSAVQSVPDVLVRPLALSRFEWQRWNAIYQDQYKYYSFLSNGIVGAQAEDYAWTHSYMDVMGLGMMTTVTLPVYNRTHDSTNQTILGVMASDVTVSEMEQHVPTKKLGPNGYAFAINANGYVVFHPNLQAVKGYVDNPPNVEFLDVEVPSAQKEEIRRRMIDLEEGEEAVTGYVVLPDNRHVDNKTRVYHFMSIPNSTFSLAVVLPQDVTTYIQSVPDTDPAEGAESLREDTAAVLTAPWQFCTNVSSPDNETTEMDMFIDAVMSSAETCNNELLQRLFFDAAVTEDVATVWAANTKTRAAFIGTEGGLTKVHPPSARDYFETMRDTVNEVYYRRAVDTSDWLFSAPYQDGDNDSANDTDAVVLATKAIKFTNVDYKPAVVGVLLEHETLRDYIANYTPECSSDVMLCYLLDDAGYLIASTDPDLDRHVGKAFEEIEPHLMHELWQKDVYLQNEQYDYQGVCEIEKEVDSAGFRSAVPPFIFELLSVHWWTSKVMWAYMNFNLMTWLGNLFGSLQCQVVAESGDEEFLGNKSCIHHLAQYSGNLDTSTFTVVCGNCSRQIATAKVAQTNLMLVAVGAECDGCTSPALLRKPMNVPDPSFHGQCIVTRRYRRRPEGCYDFNPDEDTSDCGGASAVLFNLPLLIGSVLLTTVTLLRKEAT